MGLPKDFDASLWFSPLTFQGIIGRGMAHNVYRQLFRPDGFARTKAELLADPSVAKAMPDADEIERDARFTRLTTRAQGMEIDPNL
jgi:hypothetical protein